MDFRQSLEYLYGLQRFGIKLGLDNIRALLERLGHPESGYGIVHVGGTNGKGSVSACLAEVLRQAGCRVGLYTSPHLHSFTERIRIDGVPAAEEEVARLTDMLRERAADIPATFFEFTTALALWHFQQRKVDFAVLEVGMGGRLDATNAVLPRVSVITSICRDHAEHLGADLAAIAVEKAGIIKEGIPVVLGRQEPAALEVLLERARRQKAPAYLLGRDFTSGPAAGGFAYRGLELAMDGLHPGLAGAHQRQNLALALAAAEVLRRQGERISEAALRGGVEGVRWPGRLEWWDGRDGRDVLLDGAHNEGGARALAEYLAELGAAKVRWVVGIKGVRQVGDILGPVLPHVDALYCTEPPAEETVPRQRLAEEAARAGVPAKVYASPEAALDAALAERGEGEVVLVAGSLFLVAAAREHLRRRAADGEVSKDDYAPSAGLSETV
ncbi:MAG: bifunctional folylpolyglutamate synthase/dihydrofolate synthase [Desulfuromonas sp.]|uniref:bifunctional folylpolyglutamate synthase/dihydrofolate synthase n=1 Tax=Desulfuromonas sp. TaxID=892 RepID=UPI000CBFBFF1|nr:folylpolyglutamate synthase/dihydrofolate synthase family protein [Desulfuromonas sp.]PLX83604.1 MAG: bifunctional folylpolyglutamate synthase/dihydrofolate synthase [Desulfuromonas sp.]